MVNMALALHSRTIFHLATGKQNLRYFMSLYTAHGKSGNIVKQRLNVRQINKILNATETFRYIEMNANILINRKKDIRQQKSLDYLKDVVREMYEKDCFIDDEISNIIY